MKKLSVFILFICCISFSGTAQAHFPWINLTDYTPPKGAGLHMTLGWGHQYPLAGFLKKDALASISVKGPEELKIDFTSELELKSDAISTPGTYLIGALRKPGFYSKTAQGGKAASKENLKHVIRCSYSHMAMKAVVNAGQGKGQADTVMGHPLEIIPLKDPGDLGQGDYLPVKVLYKGKPFSGPIYATYAGFSTDKSVFAYAAKTDKKGRGQIRILTPGVWLVKASHETPYPDPKICDKEGYTASLTFEIR